MKPLREIRRQNLELLVAEAGGQKALADKLGKDKNQVYQWGLPADQAASRNLGDRSARAIEAVMGRPEGWLDHEHTAGSPAAQASHSGGLDPGKLQASINFLENQFALWGRDFVAAERTLLIAGVYERLLAAPTSNMVEMSQWLADQIAGENDERQRETGSTGSNDRSRDQRRAAKA